MAEDIVQGAFVRFYERANRYDGTRPFETYFLQSPVNTALNFLKEKTKVNPFPMPIPSA